MRKWLFLICTIAAVGIGWFVIPSFEGSSAEVKSHIFPQPEPISESVAPPEVISVEETQRASAKKVKTKQSLGQPAELSSEEKAVAGDFLATGVDGKIYALDVDVANIATQSESFQPYIDRFASMATYDDMVLASRTSDGLKSFLKDKLDSSASVEAACAKGACAVLISHVERKHQSGLADYFLKSVPFPKAMMEKKDGAGRIEFRVVMGVADGVKALQFRPEGVE